MSAAADRSPLRRNAPLDVERVRAEFPILDQEVNGHPLVYLDNGATSQKPRQVIERCPAYLPVAVRRAKVPCGIHTR